MAEIIIPDTPLPVNKWMPREIIVNSDQSDHDSDESQQPTRKPRRKNIILDSDEDDEDSATEEITTLAKGFLTPRTSTDPSNPINAVSENDSSPGTESDSHESEDNEESSGEVSEAEESEALESDANQKSKYQRAFNSEPAGFERRPLQAIPVTQPIASGGEMEIPTLPKIGEMGVRERIMTKIKTESAARGIPISVPKEGARVAPLISLNNLSNAGHSEDELERAMQNLDVNNSLSAAQQESALKDLVESVVNMEGVQEGFTQPEELACVLKPYQLQGLSWLLDRERGGKKRGGILADDMGLGKTVQMIALMLANPPLEKKPSTTLIVCPVGLIDQWEKEIEKFTNGTLTTYKHHGPSRYKEGRKLRHYDIVLTSYSTLSSEWVDPNPRKKKGAVETEDSRTKKASGALFDTEYMGGFYRIILDEAHEIKNTTTKQHKAACALKGRYRWCLTGTPLQNNIKEFYALFDFLGSIVAPFHEYSEFKGRIEDPLKNKRAKVALGRLSVILKAVMLRRNKTMKDENGTPLVDLPPRTVIEVKGPFLDSDEQALYKAIETKMQLTLNKFLSAGTVMNNYTSVLTLILRMRQAAAHPALVTGKGVYEDEDAKEIAPPEDDGLGSLISGLSSLNVENKCKFCDQPIPQGEGSTDGNFKYCEACKSFESFKGLEFSTKIQRLMKVLDDIRKEGKNRKSIIFSQFTSYFDLIEPFLRAGGYKFVRYDGSLKPQERALVIDKIKNDPKTTVILISIKSGSVGLNLTCCSRVVLMDLWWNPQIENQAFDRAHRMGQTDEVKIYKITVDDTIEDRILQLQKQKAELADACLNGGEINMKANKLTMNDVLYLFKSDA